MSRADPGPAHPRVSQLFAGSGLRRCLASRRLNGIMAGIDRLGRFDPRVLAPASRPAASSPGPDLSPAYPDEQSRPHTGFLANPFY